METIRKVIFLRVIIHLKCLQDSLLLVSFASNGYREARVYILVLSPGRTLLLGTYKRRIRLIRLEDTAEGNS